MATNGHPIVGGHAFGNTTNAARTIVMGDINYYGSPPSDPVSEAARRAGSFVWREAPSIRVPVGRDSLIFQFMWNNAPSVAGHQLAEDRNSGAPSPPQDTSTHTTSQPESQPKGNDAALRRQSTRDIRWDGAFMDQTKEENPNAMESDFAMSLKTFMLDTHELAKRVGSNPRDRKRLCHAKFFSTTSENSNHIVSVGTIQWRRYQPPPEWYSDFQESDTRGKGDREVGWQNGNPSPSQSQWTTPSIGRNASSRSPTNVETFQISQSARPTARYLRPSSFEGVQIPVNPKDIDDSVISETFPQHGSKLMSPNMELPVDFVANTPSRNQPRNSNNTAPKPASNGSIMGQATPPTPSAGVKESRNRGEERPPSRLNDSTTQTVSDVRKNHAATLINEAKPQKRRDRKRKLCFF